MRGWRYGLVSAAVILGVVLAVLEAYNVVFWITSLSYSTLSQH